MNNGYEFVTNREVVAYDEFEHWMFFDSISAAATELGVDSSSISRCCQGVQSSAMGYKFEYYENFDELAHQKGDFIKHDLHKFRRNVRNFEKFTKNYVAVDVKTLRYRVYGSFNTLCYDLNLDLRNARKVLNEEIGYKTVGGYMIFREENVDFTKLAGSF